jgi:hypothetical protein
MINDLHSYASNSDAGWTQLHVSAHQDTWVTLNTQFPPSSSSLHDSENIRTVEKRPRVWMVDTNSTHIKLRKSNLLSHIPYFTMTTYTYKGIGIMDTTGGVRSMPVERQPFASECTLHCPAFPSAQGHSKLDWFIPDSLFNGEYWLLSHQKITPNTTFLILPHTESTIHQTILATTKRKDSICNFVNALECPDVQYAVPLPETHAPPLSTVYNSLAPSITQMHSKLKCSTERCTECFEKWRRWQCSMFVPRCTDVDDTSYWDDNYTNVLRTSLPKAVAHKVDYRGPWRQVLPCIATCHDVEGCKDYFPGFSCQQMTVFPLYHGKAPACNPAGRIGDGGWWTVNLSPPPTRNRMQEFRNSVRQLFGFRPQ